ncbi:MAG: Fe-S protein assembly co-chaperone HscB [Chromatiales bacterium]|jgi:molecular chaperone HscB|nr:Fe-S protein assembly co-chaperone HscB [Chromatiales bacterium]MDX9768474.1 Fe-S protein assembly co-chaperone HscB [Ectothiorhodospiraceae bacterium]
MIPDLTRNYFELFALPEAYRIDGARLADAYRRLQSQLHPDRFASASDRERLLSVQSAAQVNQAYATLKDDVARARYLLELRGVEFNEERDTATDPEFLMDQMELRERLAEVTDKDDPYAALDEVLNDIARRRAALVEGYEARLEAGDLAAARDLVIKMRFYERLQRETDRLAERLDDEQLS